MKSQSRSRVSNGSSILPGVDGRSVWARRLRDLISLHLSDLGGDVAVSEAERSIIVASAASATREERQTEGIVARPVIGRGHAAERHRHRSCERNLDTACAGSPQQS